MNIQLSSEQRQLGDSVAKYLRERYPFDVRQGDARSDGATPGQAWSGLVDLGLPALLVPEQQGGYAGTAADVLAVMMELGRALVVEPFLPSAVLATSALAAAPAGERRDSVLHQLASAERIAALALDSTGADLPSARETAQGWVLDGSLRQVLGAPSADLLVACARVQEGADATALFVIDLHESGVTRRSYRLLDQSPAADVRLERVRATPIARAQQGQDALAAARAAGIAALCAEATGAVRAAFDLTLAYVKDRTQFGRALSENQVVRHQIADMRVLADQCEGMAYLAAIAVDAPDSVDAPLDLARAKWFVGQYGRQVCEMAVQLHGGIGMSDEHPVGHCLQRLVVIDSLLGSRDEHLDAMVDQLECAL